jgi:hypothetical protein
MATKDIGIESVDTSRFLDDNKKIESLGPTFLAEDSRSLPLPVFVTRHTLRELLGENTVHSMERPL